MPSFCQICFLKATHTLLRSLSRCCHHCHSLEWKKADKDYYPPSHWNCSQSHLLNELSKTHHGVGVWQLGICLECPCSALKWLDLSLNSSSHSRFLLLHLLDGSSSGWVILPLWEMKLTVPGFPWFSLKFCGHFGEVNQRIKCVLLLDKSKLKK